MSIYLSIYLKAITLAGTSSYELEGFVGGVA